MASSTVPAIPPIDETAVLWSAEPEPHRPLVVLLHGFGSDERDLLPLHRHLPADAVYAALRAPLPNRPPQPGNAWFPLHFSDRGELLGAGSSEADRAAAEATAAGAGAAATRLLDWLDRLALVGRAPEQVVLLGFSQGGAVAVQALRQRPSDFAGIVLLSGLVAPGSEPGDEQLLLRRPPVFWGRGLRDEVIPQAAVERTAVWLPAHSTLTVYEEPGLGHGVSLPELARIDGFLRELL